MVGSECVAKDLRKFDSVGAARKPPMDGNSGQLTPSETAQEGRQMRYYTALIDLKFLGKCFGFFIQRKCNSDDKNIVWLLFPQLFGHTLVGPKSGPHECNLEGFSWLRARPRPPIIKMRPYTIHTGNFKDMPVNRFPWKTMNHCDGSSR